MLGRREFALLGTAATTAMVLQNVSIGQDKPKPGGAVSEGHHGAAMEKCAEACGKCQRECDSCSTHCAQQLQAGKKDHAATLASCQDCADLCAAAARILARNGPYAEHVCKACADACAACAAECMKFPKDAHMKACAEECRKCEKACREMLEHVAK